MFQWPFQDPKMEVLYHIRLYIFCGDIPLHRPLMEVYQPRDNITSMEFPELMGTRPAKFNGNFRILK
jgi:hypothetical protein